MKKIIYILSVIIGTGVTVQAQTTYTWNNGSPTWGGSGDFQVAANWVPTRTTPAANDILIFNQGGWITVSNVPTQTVAGIYMNGAAGIQLEGASSGAVFTSQYVQLNIEISFITAGGTNFNIVINNMVATIGGTRFSFNQGISVSFTGTVLNNGIDFYGSWTNTSRTFLAGSTYIHNSNGGLPRCVWNTNSTLSVTGVTSNCQFLSNMALNQTFGNFIWDCAGQTQAANDDYPSTETTTYNSFTLKNSNNLFFELCDGGGRTVNINNLSISGGILRTENTTGRINLYNDLIQTGGQFALGNNAFPLSCVGTVVQNIRITSISGTNYFNLIVDSRAAAPNNIVVLQNDITVQNTALTNGILSLNGKNLNTSGIFTFANGIIQADPNAGIFISRNASYFVPTITGIIGKLGISGLSNCIGNINIAYPLRVSQVLSINGIGGCGDSGIISITGGNIVSIDGIAIVGANARLDSPLNSSLIFMSNATYMHARNGGSIPLATWLNGSIASITGITTNGVGNTNQNFFNFTWNCPAQTSDMNLIPNGQTMNVRNNFINRSTGTSRLNHSNNTPTVFNTKNFTLNGGIFCGNFGGALLNVSGDFGILSPSNITNDNGGNLNISFIGANTNITITSTLTTPDNINFILAKSIVGARLTMFSNLSFPQEFNIQNGIIDLNGNSFSTVNRFPSPNTNFTSGFVSTNLNSNLMYRTSGYGGTNTYTLLGVNGVFNNLTIDNNSDDESRVFLGNTTILGLLTVLNTLGNFTVSGANSIYINSILGATGFTRSNTASTSNLIFGPQGIFVNNLHSGVVPAATWLTGSVLSLTGPFNGGGSPVFSNNQVFHDVVYDATSTGGTRNLFASPVTNATIAGSLNFKNSTNHSIALSNVTSLSLVTNNFVQSGGTVVLGNSGSSNSNVFLYGNLSLTGGSLTNNGTHNLTFVGANSSIFSSIFMPAAWGLFVNKNSISNTVNLTGNMTLPDNITFQKGLFSTGNFILSVSGTIIGASATTGWVYGNLAKSFPATSNTIRSYEIGTATVFAPATLTVPGTPTTAGNISVAAFDEVDATAFSSTCVDRTGNVNIAWRVSSVSGAALSPLNYNATFSFPGSAIDSGVNPSTLSGFMLTGSVLAPISTVGTASTFVVSGLTNFGDVIFAKSSATVTGIWRGITSSDWFDNSNWCSGTPPLSSDNITINAAIHLPLITTSGATVNNLSISQSASLGIVGSNAFGITGNLVNSGTLTGTAATLNFNAPANMSVSGTNGFSINNITFTNAGVKELQIPISVTGKVLLSDTSTTVNSNGNITLISNASSTAKINQIPSGSSILGIVHIQRFVPSKIVRRNISSPVSNADFNQLKTSMRLTGSGAGFETPTFIPSVLYYDETAINTIIGVNFGKLQPSSSSDLIEVGRGYEILIKDRNVLAAETRPNQASSPLVLSFSGIINQGNISLPVSYTNSGFETEDGWNLVGNPYPSEIDWDGAGWTKTNIVDAIYIFDPGTTFTSSTTARGQYYVYSGGSCVPAVAGCNSLIAMSQGFYVKATATGANLSVSESLKVDNTHRMNFRNENNEDKISVIVNGNNFMDETLFKLDDSYSDSYNASQDLIKLRNPTVNLSSKSAEGYGLIVNNTSFSGIDTEYPLDFTSAVNGTFTFTASKSLSNLSLDLFVRDKQLGIVEPISSTDSYAFAHNATTSSASRFSLILRKGEEEQITNISEVQNPENLLSLYPNPVTNGILYIDLKSQKTENLTYMLIGLADGKVIHSENIAIGGQNSIFELNLNYLSLSSGIYLMKVKNETMNKIFKIVIY